MSCVDRYANLDGIFRKYESLFVYVKHGWKLSDEDPTFYINPFDVSRSRELLCELVKLFERPTVREINVNDPDILHNKILVWTSKGWRV